MERSDSQHWITSQRASFEKFGAIRDTRDRAERRFLDLGLPSSKHEDWKYTSLRDLGRESFRIAERAEAFDLDRITPFVRALGDAHVLLFVDGHFRAEESEQLSTLPLDRGVTFERLAVSAPATVEFDSQRARETLTQFHNQPFLALNTAYSTDGARITIAENVKADAPILLLFVTSSGAAQLAQHPRVAITAGEGSQATIIEYFLGFGDEKSLTNCVSDIRVDENASLELLKLQDESNSTFHISTHLLDQRRASRFVMNLFNFGSALARNEIYPVLNGEGIDSKLNGLTVVNGTQHIDNFTVIDHALPHSESTEIFKGIYGQKSRGVFCGTIIVRKDAQKTNAIQSNNSLLLSTEAHVDTKPQLKIWADDVRCTHGATVGQLDEQALFYLQSRGISKREARDLLIRAFAKDVLQSVSLDSLREVLEARIDQKLQ